MTYISIITMVFVWIVIRRRLTQLNYHSIATQLPLTTHLQLILWSCKFVLFSILILIFLIFSIFSIYLQYLKFLNHQIVNFVVHFFTYDLHIMTTKHHKTLYSFSLTILHYQPNTVKLTCM